MVAPETMKDLLPILEQIRQSRSKSGRLRLANDLIESVAPWVGATIKASVKERDVNDVVQNALLAIALGIDDCHAASEGEIRNWCRTIAHRKVVEHYRGGTFREIPFSPGDIHRLVEASSTVVGISPEERQDLDQAISLLTAAKPPCVHYLHMRFIAGFDYQELGSLFGQSEDTMRMRVNRCLDLARSLISEREV